MNDQPQQRRRKTRKAPKKRKLGSSPEDDPLWGLFGVWGRVLIVFSNIGMLLFTGSSILGWGMLKFLLHVFGVGLLLLFARPNYSPFLSGVYCDSGMTAEEIEELRRMVLRKLQGQTLTTVAMPSSSTGGATGGSGNQAAIVDAVAQAGPSATAAATTIRQEEQRHGRLTGSLGPFGRLLRRIIEHR